MDDFLDYQYLVPTLHHIVDRRTHPSWYVERGQRRFHNMLFIAAGRGSVWIDGVKQELGPGMLAYHREGQEFGYETSPADPLHCLGGNFSLAVVKPCSGGGCEAYNVAGLELDAISRPANPERLLRLFADLAAAWSRRTTDGTLAGRSLFLQILEELRYSGSPELSKHRHTVDQALRRMEACYREKISLHELAAQSGLTPSYFGQLFRQHTGMTPVEYLNHIRIEEALKKMAEGHSLSHASSLAGFNDPFYFSRICKRKKGLSPTEYLRRGMLF
ncbi:MAG: AraC family transcriptional regulator [Paenibacillaceae bacterium]|jgi:AraC-like DNA-binding protein|nr:AraC family transcriptional regulator [Paenibacillaceae bacterium]